MALKSVLVSFFIMILFVSESYAFCYQKVMSAANRPSGMALGCFDTAPVYTPSTGCSVSSSAMQGCLAVYQICCDDSVKGYETGAPHIDTLTGVDVGSEYEAAKLFYEDMQVYGYAAPACEPGFQSTWEGKGMVHNSEPDPSDFTKSKVTVSSFYRQGCDVFSNTSSSSYTPIGSVGGSGGTGGTVTVDMAATNDLLTAIKAAIEGAGNKGDNTGVIDAVNNKGQGTIDAVNNIKALLEVGGAANPNALLQSIKGVLDGLGTSGTEGNQLLTDIKTILQNGTGGTGGGTGGTVNVDMTETNGLLTDSKGILGSIKDKIDSLYESVTGFFNTGGDSGSVDALSTAGVPTEGDLTGGDLETRMRSQLKEKFEFEGKKTALDIYKEHQTEWSKSDLFGFINNLNVQMGSSLPVWNLSLPRWGVNYTFDLGDSHWSYIFGVVRTLIIIGATIMAYRIIFRAGA